LWGRRQLDASKNLCYFFEKNELMGVNLFWCSAAFCKGVGGVQRRG